MRTTRMSFHGHSGVTVRRLSFGACLRAMLTLMIAATGVACRAPVDPRFANLSGDADRGQALIRELGCASCHTVPGVPGATAVVGPPLRGMADRGYIGGVLPNTEAAMIRWIQNPQAIATRTAMPDLGVSERDARDIAAYLYTLRAAPVAVRMLRGFIERGRGRQVPGLPAAGVAQ